MGQSSAYLLDTEPLPVLGYQRSKRRSHFRSSASYGYSRNVLFWL